MTKEQALKLALTVTAGVAAYQFRKYKWVASALIPVAAAGLEAVLRPKLAHAPTRSEPHPRAGKGTAKSVYL